ncbi:D-glycero-beta-D-manno-heptose 1,7-bisphosphate 7-phosphatase [Paraburkholderia sp. MMS20-SJTN17]|uniref:D,D-heptose 1,7-bisphosphate phosphatase n=1 Tax=Paraburkholderia translucens TaxID=2886945 RepID=A0ABS8KEU5_9BURK|nr:D-glycero-beta-D-manno-heptose 1,7-bisphosphate 7-phosphatase [Paraburkholderia sp. MMS20-SJTN17]MCC8403296.1 D-glycero-beta-D-manno-heptose 1,7-bisphosphate 7-phosphatase [Paraburkholderia sp. MMS20-SJTN17]
MKRRALFLDRDGVINEDFGYVHRKEDCVFIGGIFELVRTANRAGYLVAVVTNQAGIARGYYTEAQFGDFMRWMQGEFLSRRARIDRVYYCPHHPEAGVGEFRKTCACRKPQPGMLEGARGEFDLDMQASILVGDKESDMDAAQRAGVGRRYLFASRGTVDQEHCIDSLGVVERIISRELAPSPYSR